MIPGLFRASDAATAFAYARRKARFGHRDWLVWTTRDSARCAAPLSRASMKAAMLAAGCAGRFTRIERSTGVGHVWGWRLGMLTLRQLRHQGDAA